MREFEQKKKIKNRFYSRASIITLFILFLVLVRAAFSVYMKNVETKENLNRASVSLEELQKRKLSLVEETNRLQSAEGIEEEIRQKFQVSKEGEKVIVLVNDNTATTTEVAKPGFFSRIKNAILNFIK